MDRIIPVRRISSSHVYAGSLELMSQMNILITRAGGFIGQVLAAAFVTLPREAKIGSITLTDVVEPAASNPMQTTVLCVQGDLASQELCDSPLTKNLTA